MTREEIIKLAEHQGLIDYFDLGGDSVGELMLYTLVRDCIAAEREACAKVADEMTLHSFLGAVGKAIRARGQA